MREGEVKQGEAGLSWPAHGLLGCVPQQPRGSLPVLAEDLKLQLSLADRLPDLAGSEAAEGRPDAPHRATTLLLRHRVPGLAPSSPG